MRCSETLSFLGPVLDPLQEAQKNELSQKLSSYLRSCLFLET